MQDNLKVEITEIKNIGCLYKKSRFYELCKDVHVKLFHQLMEEQLKHQWAKMQFEYNDDLLSCTVCKKVEDSFDTGFSLNIFLELLPDQGEDRYGFQLSIVATPETKMSGKRIGEQFRSLLGKSDIRIYHEDYNGRVACGHYTETYIFEKRKQDGTRKEEPTGYCDTFDIGREERY